MTTRRLKGLPNFVNNADIEINVDNIRHGKIHDTLEKMKQSMLDIAKAKTGLDKVKLFASFAINIDGQINNINYIIEG